MGKPKDSGSSTKMMLKIDLLSDLYRSNMCEGTFKTSTTVKVGPEIFEINPFLKSVEKLSKPLPNVIQKRSSQMHLRETVIKNE